MLLIAEKVKYTDMEDYVTYEQALRLKELGFDWECNHYYQDNDQSLHPNFYENFNKHSKINTEDEKLIKVTLYSAPTMSQAQKWLREIKGMPILIDILSDSKEYYWRIFNSDGDFVGPSNEDYTTYEKALSAGIDKALELLKQN